MGDGLKDSTQSLSTHIFTDSILENNVTFYVIKMDKSLFLWIGDSGKFENLAVAMNIPNSILPIPTPIFGNFADENSTSLAAALSKRTGKQVFASYNICSRDCNFRLHVNERLIKEINEHPNKF